MRIVFFEKIRKVFSYVFFSVALTSCYDEVIIVPEYQHNKFNIVLDDRQVDEVLESRGEQFYISPLPHLYYGGVQLYIDHIKIRGQSALNFQRKSFSVNLDEDLILHRENEEYLLLKKFKLLSLVYDYNYIENRLAHILLNKIDLWNLHSFYTEVLFNNSNHQGLYLFVEDPEEYLMTNNAAEVVIRRYYRGEISKVEVRDDLTESTKNTYLDAFSEIYSMLTRYSGEKLYEELKTRMNIENYMKKMAFDYIVRNGDTTDEIFFWGKKKNGVVYFDILPWDYDDLFSTQPHEVGRSWAVGTGFGGRVYENHADVLDALDGRLIFSIEDDIDYAISVDDYLYQQYQNQLQIVLDIMGANIDSAFEKLASELDPFYEVPAITEQSKFDANETSKDIYIHYMTDKCMDLKKRIEMLQLKVY